MRRDSDENSNNDDGEADIIGPTSAVRDNNEGVAFQLPALNGAAPFEMTPSSTISKIGSTTLRGSARFKAAVERVMQMQEMSSVLMPIPIGAEPGVDPRRASAVAQFSHIHADCNIEVIDYGAINASFRKMSNRELVDFLTGPKKSHRPIWSKVRWINIGGISFDVLRALAIAYDLHPLSIEDVLHHRKSTQSKASYYSKHLFITILAHTLSEEQDGKTAESDPATVPMFPDHATTSSPTPEDEDADDKGKPQTWLRQRPRPGHSAIRVPDLEESTFSKREKSEWEEIDVPWKMSAGFEAEQRSKKNSPIVPNPIVRSPTSLTPQARAQAANMALVDALKKGERVNVDVAHVYIFLLRDGTIISIHQNVDPIFGLPIIKRLRQRDGLLRQAADASLLLESLIDLIVDGALSIVDNYHDKILKLERDMLIRAKTRTVRFLHILSDDLTLHKRTLDPIRTLVYGLRRYDLDRCIALLDPTNPNKEKEAVGFMSHQSKVYLADVLDHMDYILASLDNFAGIAENLINFTFNTISNSTNETMRRLSLVTVIFFPLTFLTGYFGMNFQKGFFSVRKHTDAFFWIVAGPVMFVVILLFCWNDLVRIVHYMKKKLLRRKVEQWHSIR